MIRITRRIMRTGIVTPERGVWNARGTTGIQPILHTERRCRAATYRRCLPNGQSIAPPDEVGYGFSAGGLLFPYFIGVVSSLHENGVLTREMKIAGSSAGSLISAFYHSGMSIESVMEGCLRVAADCRENGTRGRLRSVLQSVVEEMLPQDAHVHCSNKAFVAVTHIYPFSNHLISEYESRQDLIRALLASCHVPLWFDNRLLTNYKKRLCLDGGLTNLIPIPPVVRPVRISCFPMQGWGESYRAKIAPDRYRGSKYTVSELLNMALNPAAEETLMELYQLGREDSQDYVERYTIPSVDEEYGRDILFDEDDFVVEETGPSLMTRMRSVFISNKKKEPSSLA